MDDADQALAAGHFDEALPLYQAALDRDPNDVRALRSGGRAAFALQNHELAAELLSRASALITTPDPELHYLLGEALWTLGRPALAREAHERTLREIGDAQTRMEKLWVARIRMRFGDRAGADSIYEALIVDAPADPEPALAEAEMHAAAADWTGAERILRRLLDDVPQQSRALAILAWVLEGRGRFEDEMRLRKKLAKDEMSVETVRDYGRALERAGDWAGALAMYQRAARMPDADKDLELNRALERVDERMSTELAGGAEVRSDPTAIGLVGFAGLALPFGRASHWSVVSVHELARSGNRDVYTGQLRGAVVLRGDRSTAIVGGEISAIDVGADPDKMMAGRNLFAPGAFGSFRTDAGPVALTLDGELGTLWRDTPRAVFEAGRSDALTTHFYLRTLADRLVFDTGVQTRRLRMSAEDADPRALQLLGWAGADLRVWSDFSHEARGQILDDQLLHPTFAADSAVLSYRHYELFGDTDPMFAARMSLADRASIDELSMSLHKVFGAVALEVHGGFGRDWVRQLYLGRGGAGLWIAPGRRSRLSLSFDLARESVNAYAGDRRTEWVNYHVDL